MEHTHTFAHAECNHFISNYYIGFRMVSPRKGDHYQGRKFEFHSLVFLLDGEVEFSYDEFINYRFKAGNMFFIPQASVMYGTAIKDSHMLVLTFNNRVETLCDRCTLSFYEKNSDNINNDFRSLSMVPLIYKFAHQIEDYIALDMRCDYLHHIKQRELFLIMQYCYTSSEILELFSPVVGRSSFYLWVLENYTPQMAMSDMAYKYNLSDKGFSRKFSANFGMSFRNWMLKQKVKHIRLRLSMKNAKILDVMHDFNFSDRSHFYRFCKKYFGCNPTEYMRVLRTDNKEKQSIAE